MLSLPSTTSSGPPWFPRTKLFLVGRCPGLRVGERNERPGGLCLVAVVVIRFLRTPRRWNGCSRHSFFENRIWLFLTWSRHFSADSGVWGTGWKHDCLVGSSWYILGSLAVWRDEKGGWIHRRQRCGKLGGETALAD